MTLLLGDVTWFVNKIITLLLLDVSWTHSKLGNIHLVERIQSCIALVDQDIPAIALAFNCKIFN